MLSFYSNMPFFTANLQFVNSNTLLDNSNSLFVHRNMQSFSLKQLFCNSNALLFSSNAGLVRTSNYSIPTRSTGRNRMFPYFCRLISLSPVHHFKCCNYLSKHSIIQCKRDQYLALGISNTKSFISNIQTLITNTLSFGSVHFAYPKFMDYPDGPGQWTT